MVVAVDDFAEADLASQHFGQHKRIERQQQLVILGEFVAENETDGNELRRSASALGRHTLDGVQPRRHCSRLQGQVYREPPRGGFEICSAGCGKSSFTFSHRYQPLHGFFSVGVVLFAYPPGVCVA